MGSESNAAQLPISYAIRPGTELLEVQITGPVTTADFRAFFEASRQDPGFFPGIDRLIIVENVSEFPSADEIRGISARIRDRIGNATPRFAIVATDPLATGVTNMMFRGAGQDDRFAVFLKRDDAEAWLVTEGGPPG
jgi:hypothetical protein